MIRFFNQSSQMRDGGEIKYTDLFVRENSVMR